MKKVLFIAVLLVSCSSFGGPGHGHAHSQKAKEQTISKEKALELGKFHIKRLVQKKKINESWENAEHISSEKKRFGAETEFVVTFDNKNGVNGKKLYIFLKTSGEFVAANFTGK